MKKNDLGRQYLMPQNSRPEVEVDNRKPKTEREKTMDKQWGWTSYSATGWARDNGIKQYIGRFRGDDVDGYTYARIEFFARRPILALRSIVEELNQGANPLNFGERIIN